MNKYIISGQISGIGGWQLYMDARLTYLQDNGVDVYIFSFFNILSEQINLSTLAKSKYCVIPEIHWAPVAFTQKQVNNIINKMLKFIEYQEGDNIFIESTDISLSLWGEILSERTHGINFSYLLHSHIDNPSYYIQNFFFYKYQRNLLAGMSILTLPALFRSYIDIPLNDSRAILAAVKNPLSDINTIENVINELNLFRQNGGKIISYFGNLTKPHFTLVCDEVISFIQQHKSDDFCFLSLGSSLNGNAERYQQLLTSQCSNCRYMNIPSMYPVPRQLFQQMDVCIASWGCCIIAAKARTITIRLIDDTSTIPQGIMGITFNSKDAPIFPPSKQSLYDMLFDILYNNKYSSADIQHDDDELDYIYYEKLQDNIMKPFEKRNIDYYYDVSLVKFINMRTTIVRISNIIIGTSNTLNLIKLYKKHFIKNS